MMANNAFMLFFAMYSSCMQIALAAIYSGFFLWLIFRLKFFRLIAIPQWQIAGFFILKILAGIALAWIYTHWYTDRVAADTFKYFDDSEKLFQLFHSDRNLFFQFVFGTAHYSKEYLEFSNSLNTWWNQYAIYNDGRTMVRINTLLRFISLGYYHVHSIIFCFITFCGLTAFCRALFPYLIRYRRHFVYAVFLFPSLTFWSSGVMKDGIILAGTGGTMLMLSLYEQKQISSGKFMAGLFLFLALTFFSKFHIFLVLIPCFLFLVLYNAGLRVWVSMMFPLFLLFLLASALKWIFPTVDIFSFMAEKQAENIRMALETKAGSYFEIPGLNGRAINFIVNIPTGFLNAVIRPLPHEIHSPLMMLSAAENIIVFVTIVFVLLRSVKKTGTQSGIFFFSVMFVLILFTVIGMMTPVSGALVRYKIQGLPFLIFALFSLMEGTKKE